VKTHRPWRRRRLLKRRETLSDWCLVPHSSSSRQKAVRRPGGSLHSLDAGPRTVNPPVFRPETSRWRREPGRPATRHSETGSSTGSAQLTEQYGGSQATLRPSTSASHSVSDFSVHSGEPELEFDLYDCDLDNVMRAPGSMFAPAYWDGEEEEEEEAMTPTLGLEMVQLFPREEDERTEEEEEEAMTPTLGLEMVQLFPREEDERTEEGEEEEEEIVCRMKKRDQVPLFILYFPEQTSSV
jgi:hypothetical protein